MSLDVYVESVLSDGTELPVRLAHALTARTGVVERIDDAEVPTFALLRARARSPLGERAVVADRGRHLAAGVGVPSVEVANPTVDLLERTLAGLRAWTPLVLA